ncbi:unnamed protein product [Prorocentrum cordatum]|uniref:J domain-containing protein n=1 Tax=Prorocentrum cordatum TaxID=2364126 RepID=A0ABN9VCT9_9DINO|nr:unnamed protein product [Polarella glacialis]
MVAAAFLFPDGSPCALLPLRAAPPAGVEGVTGKRSAGPAAANEVVFSLSRPRDAIAGAASGLKTAARSTAMGAAALARAPLEAAHADGLGEALWCLGEGLAGAVLLPCGGLAVGLSQCARGVANTPEAVVQSLRGLAWCSKQRAWAPPAGYSLPEDRRARRADDRAAPPRGPPAPAAGRPDRDGGEAASSSQPPSWSSPGAASTVGAVQRHVPSLYAALRCHPAASRTELRHAYYRESRRCHPDKAGGSPQAVAQFQALSEAYKVLRDPALRRAYDVGGHEAVVQASTTVDLGELYAAVMSGRQWRPYVGQFALERILATDFRADAGPEEAELLELLGSVWCAGEGPVDAWQAEREVRCAVALAERLRQAVSGEVHAFGRAMQAEARRLACAPFAPLLLRAVAEVYDSEAKQFLHTLPAFDLRREAAQARARARLLAQQARAVAVGARALLSLHGLARLEEQASEGTSSTQRPRGASHLYLEHPEVDARLPLLAGALWQLTVLDVEGTVGRVCRRVLRDTSTDLVSRVRRAEAMQIMATAMRAAADARGTSAGSPAGLPGEDVDFLRCRVRDLAARLASGGGVSDDE